MGIYGARLTYEVFISYAHTDFRHPFVRTLAPLSAALSIVLANEVRIFQTRELERMRGATSKCPQPVGLTSHRPHRIAAEVDGYHLPSLRILFE